MGIEEPRAGKKLDWKEKERRRRRQGSRRRDTKKRY
jgi:hypothetical protein